MKEKFDAAEWEELKLLPFMVFNVVAFADGNLDPKEVDEFSSRMMKSPLLIDPLHRELSMAIVGSDIGDLQKRSLDFSKLQDRFKAAKTTLRAKLTEEEYQRFVNSLLIDAKNVAAAAGGGVCEEETKALLTLALLLEIDLSAGKKYFSGT